MKKLTQKERRLAREYGHLFIGTGGNDLVELMERNGVTYFNNIYVAVMQECCHSQLTLLCRLKQNGLLARNASLASVVPKGTP